MNNIFRPISLSEGFINEKKDTLLRKFSKNNLNDIYIKLEEDCEKVIDNHETKYSLNDNLSENAKKYIKPLYIDNINISVDNHSCEHNYQQLINKNDSVNENKIKNIEKKNVINVWTYYLYKKLTPSKNMLIYFLKKLFMFMFHLSLISIFEIIFFFTIVSVYENEAIVSIIINFFSGVPNMCNNMSLSQKEYFTNVFDSIINVTQITDDANISYINRKNFNNKLFVNAWMYFLVIISIDIFLILIKIYYKIKINFKKIILENIVMILILAIYEYMFFKSIIFLYQNISQNELLNLIVKEFDTCLVS